MLPQHLKPGTHALVLAAGAGRRFGGGKLCSPFEGKPLVAWAAEAALATGVERVTIVVGADAERVADALSHIRDERLRSVGCSDWKEGLSNSLICGLASLPADATALLLFLGDMPRVSAALAERLLEAVLAGAPAAMLLCQGLPAHPVAMSSSLFPALRGLTGDKGARALLAETPGAVTLYTDDAGSLFDVDTKADLQPTSAPARSRKGI